MLLSCHSFVLWSEAELGRDNSRCSLLRILEMFLKLVSVFQVFMHLRWKSLEYALIGSPPRLPTQFLCDDCTSFSTDPSVKLLNLPTCIMQKLNEIFPEFCRNTKQWFDSEIKNSAFLYTTLYEKNSMKIYPLFYVNSIHRSSE